MQAHNRREMMLVDCDQCELRDIACSDCLITALAGTPRRWRDIGEAERRALRVLADAKLVPPLRLRVRQPLPRAS
jgi:hypothetical protein